MRAGLSAARAASPANDLFGRWLNAPVRAPVAVALSGGGDSLSLLHMAKTWADAAGRPLLALTVDHGLQATGAAWAAFAAEKAARLGVAHRTLVWRGAKPQTGLPAAARAARHALLADAAREAGARVVLMGHTADDRLEAALMREAGSTTPSPRAWSPSPAWPEGRGVFLLRPLLSMRRADLRAWLRSLGETWIEDPANDDPRFARTLARRRLGAVGAAPPESSTAPHPRLSDVRQDAGGALSAPLAAFRSGAPPEAARLAATLALCVAGRTRTPPAAASARLAARLCEGAPFIATLAGARIEAGLGYARFCREAGELARGGLAGYALPLGESVFDGRFAMRAAEPGWRVAAMAGHTRRLPDAERRRLKDPAPAVRAALPVAISPSGDVHAPTLSNSKPVIARSVVFARLTAALGGVADEAALWRVAKPRTTP